VTVAVNRRRLSVVYLLDSEDIPHVMISYHWSAQKTMIYVRDKLKAVGYKVWMDVDNMSEFMSEHCLNSISLAVKYLKFKKIYIIL